jgi:hypothetical protein
MAYSEGKEKPVVIKHALVLDHSEWEMFTSMDFIIGFLLIYPMIDSNSSVQREHGLKLDIGENYRFKWKFIWMMYHISRDFQVCGAMHNNLCNFNWV